MPSQSDPESWNGFLLRVDESLPPDTIKIEGAETHLVKLHGDESAEFIGGPLDGAIVAEKDDE